MSRAVLPDLRLDICLYQNDDQWIAHCLQLDIAVSDKDRRDAIQECIETCTDHLAFAIQTDRLDTAFKMAPPDIVRGFLKGRKIGTITVPLVAQDEDDISNEPVRVDFQEAERDTVGA